MSCVSFPYETVQLSGNVADIVNTCNPVRTAEDKDIRTKFLDGAIVAQTG